MKKYIKSRNRNIKTLFTIVIISCTALIVLNYITIRILSGSRAYVNGESQYSKGQKEASRHLIMYLFTENSKEWERFNFELIAPLGDQSARIALNKNPGDFLAKKGFRAGKVKEEDLDDIIWIYRNFQSIPFVKKAVQQWELADKLINQLRKTGADIDNEIKSKHLNNNSRNKFLAEISILSDKLSVNQQEFSNTIGDGTQELKNFLISANAFFIFLIISCVGIYYFVIIKRILDSKVVIKKSQAQLKETVSALKKTKIELSREIVQHKKLIGSISHDIKSPIKFLTMTSKFIYENTENSDNLKLRKSTKSVYYSMEQLYHFIDGLLTYSKIFLQEKTAEKSVYELRELVQHKCNLFNEIAKASNNSLSNEIEENVMININQDILRVILHNIIDNAIKNTENGHIRINSYNKNNKLYLEVEDTGKGFKEEDLEYYNQLSNDQSSEKFVLKNNGMGLPMAIELSNLINGNIKISSTPGMGSKIKIITDID